MIIREYWVMFAERREPQLHALAGSASPRRLPDFEMTVVDVTVEVKSTRIASLEAGLEGLAIRGAHEAYHARHRQTPESAGLKLEPILREQPPRWLLEPIEENSSKFRVSGSMFSRAHVYQVKVLILPNAFVERADLN